MGAFSLLVLGLPVIASAQYNGQYDPYGRNGGYNNGGYGNGGYNNGYYGNIRNTLRDLKDRSNNFKRSVDRMDNNRGGGIFGGYGGYGNNNRNNDKYLRDLANNFKKAADRLENHYDDRNQSRAQQDAQEVLNLGSQLDNELRRSRGNGYLQNEWNAITQDLRVVANMYGRGYNNNRYPQNGGYRNNRPSWWPF